MGKLKLIPPQASGVASVMGGALAMARPNEINRICPTITPTLGAELVINGNFAAWTGDDPDNWTVLEALPGAEVSEVGAGQGHGGVGLGLCNLYRNAGGSTPVISQTLAVTGNWYQVAFDFDTRISGTLQIRITNDALTFTNYTTTGSKLFTGRAGVGDFVARTITDPADVTIDNVSLKQIAFSSALTFLGTRSQRPGTYTCHPTVAAATQCGMLIGYADANNFVMAIVNRVAGQAQLLKNISGTYTSVIAGAITYGAAQELKVIVASNGTDYSLYYNGVQVGATTAINDAGLGTKVYGFNTYAGNTVGLVTTSGATS